MLREQHSCSLQIFRCPKLATFSNRTFNWERSLTTCRERVKKFYPKNVYQTQETLFDKLHSFGIEYTNDQTLFKNLGILDFESICVQEESFNDTDTTIWITKHVPILVSHFLKSCERANFPLQLRFSSSCYFFYRCSWKFSSPKKQ